MQIKEPDFNQTEHGKNCTNPWILMQLKIIVILFLWNSFNQKDYTNIIQWLKLHVIYLVCVSFALTTFSKLAIFKITSEQCHNKSSNCLARTQYTYPPPMVRILLSPARNMFAVLETFSSWRPTHSYFFLSGDSVNTNVSPVPK